MKPMRGIPVTVLQDKERLADYILARAPLPAAPAPAPTSRAGRLRARLDLTRIRPTAMTVSTAIHVLVLVGLLCWSGLRSASAPKTAYSINFDGSLGESGVGREAEGSG